MSLIIETSAPEPQEPVLQAGLLPGVGLPAAVRKHERGEIEFSVKIFSAGTFGHTVGRSTDLSLSGMAFYAPVELALDQEVHLHFALRHSPIAFGVAAKVRSVNGFRYGVEFEALTLRETAEIERILKIIQANR